MGSNDFLFGFLGLAALGIGGYFVYKEVWQIGRAHV